MAVGLCCDCRCKNRRRSINARQTTTKMENNPTDAQSRWYGRMKGRSHSDASATRSPGMEDVPLQHMPRQARPDGPCSISRSQSDQPPAYTQPSQPQRVFLNPDQNPFRRTFDSMQTTTTPLAYNRRHNDELYGRDSQDPIMEATRTLGVDNTPAPSYTRSWNPWSRH